MGANCPYQLPKVMSETENDSVETVKMNLSQSQKFGWEMMRDL